MNYDDGDAIDPRRAARYIEDKLPKDDRIVACDGGHAGMVFAETFSILRAENWAMPWILAR